jgi:DNA-binding transcriptional MerR regulator
VNIGQVSKATGVSQRMIRHYEGIGLMPSPDRRDNGYRDYPPRSIERLRFIANARDLGFSVDEIGALSVFGTTAKEPAARSRPLPLCMLKNLPARRRHLKRCAAPCLNWLQGAAVMRGPIVQSSGTRRRTAAPTQELTVAHRKPKEATALVLSAVAVGAPLA